MWEWVSVAPYLLIAVAVILFGLLMIGVSLMEKQRIRQLEAVSKETLPPASTYFNAMNEAVAASGYELCSTYSRLPKTSNTNAYMAAWLSPDKTMLACVLGGKVARMNYRKTLLMSWIEAENVLVTRDDFGEVDHSGTTEIDVVLNADFNELATRHAERLRSRSTPPQLLDSGQILTYWERLEETRARRLMALGLARFVDEPNGIWRYTLKGGWKNFIEVVNGIKMAKRQMDRAKKKRPGS